MNTVTKALIGVTAIGLAAGIAADWRQTPLARAADHLDPPGRTDPSGGAADRAADIADVFAWHQGTGANAHLVTILTFDGPNMPVAGQAMSCDRDVQYAIHLDNGTAQFTIDARFGKDDQGTCFVRLTGVPGAGNATLAGPIERPFTRAGVQIFAGLRDDPFFFDLTGFRETLQMGTIRMVNDRDFFAGKNTSALVVEFPLAAVSPTGQPVRVYGTTARIGGV
ncbi:MAG: DUF4331 family protein [Kofleriaceae bacterium]